MSDLKKLFEKIVKKHVEEEKEKMKTREPDMFLNQKGQMWYSMMNVMDKAEQEETE